MPSKGNIKNESNDNWTSTKNIATVAPKIVSNAVITLLAPSLANSFKLCMSDVILATKTPVLFFSK